MANKMSNECSHRLFACVGLSFLSDILKKVFRGTLKGLALSSLTSVAIYISQRGPRGQRSVDAPQTIEPLELLFREAVTVLNEV